MSARIGTVTLRVKDIARMTEFYETVIGLRVQHIEGDTVFMGVGRHDLLALMHTPHGKHYPRTTGLYHFALLVPTRPDLALALKHLSDTNTPLEGLGDHIVSEAIYLADPEGNGVEIYADRPRDQWYKDGQMQLVTLPVDVNDLMTTLPGRPFDGLPADTTMGHIHLHVASVPEAEAFYTGTLGMDAMFNVGSAVFLAYDGYHHHIGANTWGGRDAPPDDALGLDHFLLHLDRSHYETIVNRTGTGDLHDPSLNRFMLRQG